MPCGAPTCAPRRARSSAPRNAISVAQTATAAAERARELSEIERDATALKLENAQAHAAQLQKDLDAWRATAWRYKRRMSDPAALTRLERERATPNAENHALRAENRPKTRSCVRSTTPRPSTRDLRTTAELKSQEELAVLGL